MSQLLDQVVNYVGQSVVTLVAEVEDAERQKLAQEAIVRVHAAAKAAPASSQMQMDAVTLAKEVQILRGQLVRVQNTQN
jgi:hypothetical protein